ncbi:MAG: hypothetical protein ABIA93_06790 [Candidatus Woesearchaeota archaeon]
MKATELFSGQPLDPSTITLATATAGVATLALGSVIGMAADTYEDFCGTRPSERLPASIARLNRKTKLGLAGILTAASLGITAATYVLHHNSPTPEGLKPSSIEQIVQNDANVSPY